MIFYTRIYTILQGYIFYILFHWTALKLSRNIRCMWLQLMKRVLQLIIIMLCGVPILFVHTDNTTQQNAKHQG
jgi:hypothetical protein